MHRTVSFSRLALLAIFTLAMLLVSFMGESPTASAQAASNGKIGSAFEQAASKFGVPAPLLKAICYMEGRLSNHGGSPSIDHGFGCMHLIQNQRGDTLDQAASILHVSADQLKTDIATNILGGAAVLRAEALQLSSTHTPPASLAGWYGAVAEYSHSSVRSTALMYADAVYKILNTGFTAQSDTGETVTLAPQAVKPNTATAAGVKSASTLPAGCSSTPTGDYPLAVNCILNPNIFDCTLPTTTYPPCSYEERTDAPYPLPVDYVVIHDTEGSLQDALNAFQNTNPGTAAGASANYIVDTDGTVYQIVHDDDFTYNVGNYWYNQHSIGIEHVGYDATGFLWYNAAQYLGSAKLVAYLLKKYNLPLSRNDIVAHGTVPPSVYTLGPNHVDPGPYWMWDYYFSLIHQQGIPYPQEKPTQGTIELHTAKHLGQGGVESPGDFNFYYLYNGPSTASGLIPQLNTPTDITDETNNVEADISYAYFAKVKDPAGTGDTMYEIWYGESDQAHNNPSSMFQDGKLAWLAVPPGTNVTVGTGELVAIYQSGASQVFVYGNPIAGHIVGSVPNGAVFDSGYTVIADGTTTLWYEINFNHRQAWVPASDVTVVHAPAASAIITH
jgi:N-acetyl-anhydromuramyl-L-alanine amidase AmpD